MEVLTDDNFEQYLKDNYDRFVLEAEFNEDLLRFKHIKKLITRYIIYGRDDLRERLILNHLIVLVNVFGPEVVTRSVFLRMEDTLSYIKPFMVLLSILPNKIFNIKKECVIDTDEILMDRYIVERLRMITRS